MKSRRLTRGTTALLALLVLTLAGCAVTLIAPYDAITDQGLTDLHRKVDGVLGWLAAERPTHLVASVHYDDVSADLRTLRARNEARSKNDLTLQQLDAIRDAWAVFEAEHKRSGTLSPTFIDVARGILARAIGAALKLEMEKRRLR